MIHPTRILLTAALGLIMSALTAKSADTQITALPFIIHAPGTYSLVSDLTVSCDCSAFSIDPSVTTGTILIDLKGHTINGTNNIPGSGGGSVLGVVNDTRNNYVLIIRNGTIHLFVTGIDFEKLDGSPSAATVEINHIVFSAVTTGIIFYHIGGAKVINCTFDDAVTGIRDTDSGGGNLYANIVFGDPQGTDIIINTDEYDPLSFDRLQFNQP
jgi:hypothetical protein